MAEQKLKPADKDTVPIDFGEHLQHAVDTNRSILEGAASSPATQAWLKSQLCTPEGTQLVYGLLERMVSGPRFLGKLTEELKQRDARQEAPLQGTEVLKPEWWEPPESSASSGDGDVQSFEEVKAEDAEARDEPLESYVLVEKEDVLEAIGAFVAAYLAGLPQAQSLEPKELQAAIKSAFKELRKSRMQQLWGWGRAIYRCVAFSYGAFSVYENPWIVRAVLAALWTASRLMFGLLI